VPPGGSRVADAPGPQPDVCSGDRFAGPALHRRQALQGTPSPAAGTRPRTRYIADLLAATVAATGTAGDPAGYGQTVARELFPDVLSYVVGTPATYGYATRNGRTLADNAPEAMLSLVTNTAVPSGLKRTVSEQYRTAGFPYVVPA
jgi:hypothetical protein